eukprot:30556_1
MKNIIIKKEPNNANYNSNELTTLNNNNGKYNDYCDDNDVIVTNDNLNDGIIRILNDNINISWCPKCKVKVTRTDSDIINRCPIMTCREEGCGDSNNYTFWCWDCRNIMNMNKLLFDSYTNEPAGACQNCRKKSRLR